MTTDGIQFYVFANLAPTFPPPCHESIRTAAVFAVPRCMSELLTVALTVTMLRPQPAKS